MAPGIPMSHRRLLMASAVGGRRGRGLFPVGTTADAGTGVGTELVRVASGAGLRRAAGDQRRQRGGGPTSDRRDPPLEVRDIATIWKNGYQVTRTPA
jgi:hypothetical protein